MTQLFDRIDQPQVWSGEFTLMTQTGLDVHGAIA